MNAIDSDKILSSIFLFLPNKDILIEDGVWKLAFVLIELAVSSFSNFSSCFKIFLWVGVWKKFMRRFYLIMNYEKNIKIKFSYKEICNCNYLVTSFNFFGAFFKIGLKKKIINFFANFSKLFLIQKFKFSIQWFSKKKL